MAWFESHLNGGGGGSTRVPSMLGFYSRNINTIGSLSHTFAEGGKIQFVSFILYGDGGTLSDPTFELNGTAITPTKYTIGTETHDAYFYGELTVEENDVLTMTNAVAVYNSGMQLAVMKDADLSLFSHIGRSHNDSTTFALPNDEWVLQMYASGYWNSYNTNNCMISKPFVSYNTNGQNYQSSIPTPSGYQPCYYGYTWAVTI